MGLAHYQLHHDLQAEELLRKALVSGKGNRHEQARWNTQLGSLMLSQRKFYEAQNYYSAALELADNDPELRAGIELQQVELLPLFDRLDVLNRIQKRLSLLNPTKCVRAILFVLLRYRTNLERMGEYWPINPWLMPNRKPHLDYLLKF